MKNKFMFSFLIISYWFYAGPGLDLVLESEQDIVMREIDKIKRRSLESARIINQTHHLVRLIVQVSFTYYF